MIFLKKLMNQFKKLLIDLRNEIIGYKVKDPYDVKFDFKFQEFYRKIKKKYPYYNEIDAYTDYIGYLTMIKLIEFYEMQDRAFKKLLL